MHGTHDEPEVRERGMAIAPGQEIFVAVGAEQTFTTGEEGAHVATHWPSRPSQQVRKVPTLAHIGRADLHNR